MHLEIRHLKLVDAIAREGGMTKAANHLHLTQSALSHQLKEIEERLNTPLFLRLNKRMVLTEAGQTLLASAQKILLELERTEHQIQRMASGQQGVLRISTQCNTGYYWLPSMLKRFNEKYPNVEVQIVVEATSGPVEALLEGKLDIAITFRKLPDKRLAFFPLFEDELLVVTHAKHPFAQKDFVRVQDLANEALIVYSTPIETSLVFQNILIPANVQPKAIYRMMLTEAIVEMVKAGIGVGILARWAVAPYLKSGELRGVRLTRKGIRREWYSATLRTPAPPAYSLEFMRLLATHCSNAPALKAVAG